MIDKSVIMEETRKNSLSPNTIEKDYALNWILAGISESKELHEDWIFKGGTCLKKCYFESYRFSEDLDFTITNLHHRDSDYLRTTFSKIGEWIYEQIGLELPNEGMNFELYKNPRNQLSIQGKMAYKGPMQRKGNLSTIKLDLCWDEIIVEQPVISKIYHPYNEVEFDFRIKTYCIEEIFAEKLRALVERMRPRDLYDIVHLYNDSRWSPDRKCIVSALEKKCIFKEVEMPTLELINAMPNKSDLFTDWKNMLAHQIFELESPDYYWEQLPKIFQWLYQN